MLPPTYAQRDFMFRRYTKRNAKRKIRSFCLSADLLTKVVELWKYPGEPSPTSQVSASSSVAPAPSPSGVCPRRPK